MIAHPYIVRIPDEIHNLPQDREYCVLLHEGKPRKIRLHDYHEIYQIPGLYEHLFYNILHCQSPEVVSSTLVEQIERSGDSASDLVVLDLGAGNGMVGEALCERGVETVVGIDILEEAATAAERDRPDLYRTYLVEDLCNLTMPAEEYLTNMRFNCLVSVAALGFGDIPPAAFACAFNLLVDDAWVAFNIKTAFLENSDESGFAKLLQTMQSENMLDVYTTRRYRHRMALDGQPLYYLAVIGRKRADIPQDFIEAASSSRSYLA